MSKPLLFMICSLFLVVGLTFWLFHNERSAGRPTAPNQSQPNPTEGTKSGESEMILLCAASNQSVIEQIRKQYEEETGRRVSVQYGNSQSLLAQLEISKRGDLYLPADNSFLENAKGKKLIEEVIPIATMPIGLVVKKGNPKGITSLADLKRDDVRLVQADPEAAAVTKVARSILEKLGQWESIKEATRGFRSTVTEVATDVQISVADVGIVYSPVLVSFPELEFVPIVEFESGVSQVSLGVASSTKQPAAALHFARYIAASDRGLKTYQQQGFTIGEGDQWSDVPELNIYAGSMLRPAIEDSIIAFEAREGVKVSRTYNGCGILVAQMKAGQIPDAYFACDLEFMSQVTDIFPEATEVSQNELVIMVPKGNPKNIASLRDLTKPGLRVGIGHEKQCAMGWITQNTFRESGLQQELMSNVAVQTPTGDMLVNQLRTGALDAAVAYLSNAAGAAEFLDAIEIQGIPCSTATQPWSVAKNSKYPLLADRLFQRICSAESQDVFEAEGFQWQLGAKKLNIPKTSATPSTDTSPTTATAGDKE
ncbi:MAG: molybdate ABC transporter substrate-binding protein [Planctomycetes bacterium]|nr:molybdate ABC transporter substrate-binding protein [Planctomycetota bacterium]